MASEVGFGRPIGLETPESTPGPDDQRNRADEARKAAELAKQHTHTIISPEQKEAVTNVLKCPRVKYFKILGLENKFESKRDKKVAIINAFRKIGCLTHPNYNTLDKAALAYASKWTLFLH
jgi:hypothetical protein